jgi:hypothetical protein
MVMFIKLLLLKVVNAGLLQKISVFEEKVLQLFQIIEKSSSAGSFLKLVS